MHGATIKVTLEQAEKFLKESSQCCGMFPHYPLANT
jgi:hypothetical protein